MVKGTLILFAKPPRLGRAKRRLARRIGAVAAWVFYRRTVEAMVWRLGRHPGWKTRLTVDAGPARWPRNTKTFPQGRGDLGRRMEQAFRALAPGPAVLIGSDIPEVRAPHIEQAFRLLGNHDAVFGPAEDGGYWLVGFKDIRRWRRPFAGVRWSTEHALADTLKNTKGRKVAMGATLKDVD